MAKEDGEKQNMSNIKREKEKKRITTASTITSNKSGNNNRCSNINNNQHQTNASHNFLLWMKGHNHVNIKGRSRRLIPKAHILDDPLSNPYDVLKVLLGLPYGP